MDATRQVIRRMLTEMAWSPSTKPHWHGTRFAKEVLTQGLLQNPPKRAYPANAPGGATHGGVYFFTAEKIGLEAAIEGATCAAARGFDAGGSPGVLEVDLSGLEIIADEDYLKWHSHSREKGIDDRAASREVGEVTPPVPGQPVRVMDVDVSPERILRALEWNMPLTPLTADGYETYSVYVTVLKGSFTDIEMAAVERAIKSCDDAEDVTWTPHVT